MSGHPGCVVHISGKRLDGTPFNGTGFLVSPGGHVATCRHVVISAAEIRVQLPFEEPWPYQVLEEAVEQDLALLQSCVPPSVPTPCAALDVEWRKDLQVGTEVVVWGCSAAEHFTAAQAFKCMVSGFAEPHGRIGLNGDINPGDSGAPAVNAAGTVIGIAQVRDPKRSGHAMLIPISDLIPLLKRHGIDAEGKSGVRADQKELKSRECEIIRNLLARFEDIRVHYRRAYRGQALEPGFVVNYETPAWTWIDEYRAVNDAFIPDSFRQLLDKKSEILGRLALAINPNNPNRAVEWDKAENDWETLNTQISRALKAEYYDQGIMPEPPPPLP